jgi:diguanylate cyclase
MTAYWALVIAALLVYAGHAGLGIGTSDAARALLDGWLYSGLVLAGALGIAARAVLVRRERAAWSFIAAAALVWSAGDIYWWRAFGGGGEVQVPSVADALFLGFYPLAYAGLVLLVRARVRRFHASQWLDGIAAALCVAAVGVAVLLPPIIAASEGSVAAVATNLAYPLGDLLVLALVVALVAVTGWRFGRDLGLLIAGCAAFAAADALYLYRVALDTYVEGTLPDALWPAALVVVGLAAWQPSPATERGRIEGWSLLIVPAVVCASALGLLVLDHYRPGGPVAVWLAAGALVVGMLRAGLTFRENIALADSHRQAVTDALTGLPNRRLFHDRAEQAILRARRTGESVGLMVIDLDRFKEVNDTLGHRSGDILLTMVAERLRRTVRATDTVARLGGDEFGVLLAPVAGPEAALRIAEAVNRAIGEPATLGRLSLDTEASIGIALFPEQADDVEDLLQRADVAMYVAKRDHLGQQLYRPEDDDYSPERLSLAGELRRAIEREELVLHYQPKYDLQTGAGAGHEVLVRWQHPERGLLPPGEFIPLAERTTLIRPLTLHVLDRALAQCARWSRQGTETNVAVNISARSLLDLGFPGEVRELLDRWGLAPGRLELEITETVLMANPARALEVLTQLNDAGVGLSIDDFGMGYSSLNYLKQLPVNVIKIDRSFVMGMGDNPADAMIVQSTIDLGRNLGMRVVAEGIEHEGALAALRGMGCDVGQGFYLGRPAAAGALTPGSPVARPHPTG